MFTDDRFGFVDPPDLIGVLNRVYETKTLVYTNTQTVLIFRNAELQTFLTLNDS